MRDVPAPKVGTAFPRAEASYAFLAALFVVILVLTNIIGTKLFVLFEDGGPSWILDGEPWTLTSGIITYPLTFFLTDVVTLPVVFQLFATASQGIG